MKRATSILLCAILAITLLAACGNARDFAGPFNAYTEDSYSLGLISEAPSAAPMPAPMPETAIMYDAAEFEFYDNDSGGSQAAGGGISVISTPVSQGMAEKIIYSGYADIETMNFDEAIKNIDVMLRTYGAFIENSSVSGVNYASRFHGGDEYRNASFTIRVPTGNFDAMKGSLEHFLGNVVFLNSNADNITSQFFDTQSRLNSLTIQEERLLSMLSQADEITDLIALEERLGDIRYQIESLTTILNTWQNRVDYSTLSLSIREVEQFTEQVQIHRTYWQQIGDGFMATIRSIGSFFMDLFMWLIVAAPVLIILAVVAIVGIIIVKRLLRESRKKRSENQQNSTAYQNMPGYMPQMHTAQVYPPQPPVNQTPEYTAAPENHE